MILRGLHRLPRRFQNHGAFEVAKNRIDGSRESDGSTVWFRRREALGHASGLVRASCFLRLARDNVTIVGQRERERDVLMFAINTSIKLRGPVGGSDMTAIRWRPLPARLLPSSVRYLI
jgi:hypothetical protein